MQKINTSATSAEGIKPGTDGQNTDRQLAYAKIEKDWNAKILEITMRIKDHYPQLSQYLEEMPVTVPSENDPEMNLNQLKSYYESLNSLLEKYKADHPEIQE